MDNQIKIALPKGRLLAETADLLRKADWGLNTYHKGLPSYRPKSQRFPDLLAKVFHEKDIPIQVAVGNYDLGICGLDWVDELLVKYPSSAVVKLRNLGYGQGALFAAVRRSGGAASIEEIQARKGLIRIASEYPNLAESLALNLRLKRFSIFPLWGAAEVYPPENAEVVIISGRPNERVFNQDLVAISGILDFSACVIANRNSWERKDLSQILASLDGGLPAEAENSLPITVTMLPEVSNQYPVEEMAEDAVRLALPDGHQQQPTVELLNKAGICIGDYPSATGNRRPAIGLEGVTVKVIRPQDMPLQVANGNFDLAISGRDWLTDHLYQFPSSPVTGLLDLKFGWVRIVAVVTRDLPVEDVDGLRRLYAERGVPVRIASEYVNIADEYARDNHLAGYRVIPTWGATEAFLPEDADLLVENTETGGTIARHNLKIIDTLFESTACLIGNKDSFARPSKSTRMKSITETLRAAVGDKN